MHEQRKTIVANIKAAIDKRVGFQLCSWKDWSKKHEQISYEEKKAQCQRVLSQMTEDSMLVVLQHTGEIGGAFENNFAFGDYDTSPDSVPVYLTFPLDINDPKVYEIKKFFPTAKIVWYKTALENYIKQLDSAHETFAEVSEYLNTSTDLMFCQEVKQ